MTPRDCFQLYNSTILGSGAVWEHHTHANTTRFASALNFLKLKLSCLSSIVVLIKSTDQPPSKWPCGDVSVCANLEEVPMITPPSDRHGVSVRV